MSQSTQSEKPEPHAMMAVPNHDELAQQRYFMALRQHINTHLLDGVKATFEDRVRPTLSEQADRHAARHALRKTPGFLYWGSLLRSSQELMWSYVGESVDRQSDDLEQRYADLGESQGTLTLDPEFELPPYLAALDQHLMPGGYGADSGDPDVRAGAVYDRGGAIYQLERNGAGLNDGRGHTLAAFLLDNYPAFSPARILDMGCTVGNSTLPLCDYFPEARIDAIDVGAALLRYAHARAESMHKVVHFSQQNAEQTHFEDDTFDLVVSSVMFHETSRRALPRILSECARILKPGGVVAHLEVPVRYDQMELIDQVIRDWQSYHNHEPFWGGVCATDVEAALVDAGFQQVISGYQPSTTDARGPRKTFSKSGDASLGNWFVFSGVLSQ